MRVEFPKSLSFLLFEPARLKVLYGGRGAGKTENMARALIHLSRKLKLRILCAREFQNSIAESVYETIRNAVIDMGLEDEFEFTQKNITCIRTGSEYIFRGLRYNINSLKSLSRIDVCWVDEAANVSKASWDKLEPTIRGRHENDPNGMGGPFKKGPEIWVSFNPELDDDETYKRFILEKDIYAPDFYMNERYAFVKKINYSDNKWFPPDQKRLMELSKEKNENDYLHIWEGHTKQVLDGAIYADELRKVISEGRRTQVRYDPSRPVHTFWDLGHDDYTSIWFVQQVGVEYNLINFFQDRLKKIPYYIEKLQEFKYNYGRHYLPHDGDTETVTNRSAVKQLRGAYPSDNAVKVVPRVSRKIVGIRAARIIFDLCNFDEVNTADGWQCLTRYQYSINENTGAFSREPLHNEYSHGADAFQTFALSLKSEIETKKDKMPFKLNTERSRNNIINFNTKSNTGWMV